jgi:hypothetical protein
MPFVDVMAKPMVMKTWHNEKMQDNGYKLPTYIILNNKTA